MEMEANADAEKGKSSARAGGARESLLSRKYVIPFILACVILACNQATGVNSIIGYNADIFIQGGLSDVQAHYGNLLFTLVNFFMTMVAVMLVDRNQATGVNSIIGYNADIFIQGGLSDVQAHYGNLLFTLVNFFMTMVAVMLVDRKGRKFLLTIGTAGIIASLVAVGSLFPPTEKLSVDAREAVQASVGPGQNVTIAFNADSARRMLATAGDAGRTLMGRPLTLSVIYSYGGFRSATAVMRSDDAAARPVEIDREGGLPSNRVSAFLSNPFASLERAKAAPLKIENALVTPVPSTRNGWLTALFTFSFMAFFAIGPGVVVWLALSELMPTRIRSNGMSIALTLNQAVSTTIAAVFLPTVGRFGYSTMFFLFAGFTVVYFITAAFFLPETKGKTLEEIEQHFEGAPRKA